MAYKYEQRINDAFFRASRDGRNVNNELLAELKEVYRKAKAFDEVLDIDLAQHDEEYADNAMKVVNKFTEGKND
ncbi:DUF1024 family protein [Staphylococcus saprophyticus]|nr:DUF1024 family protein [Staphylococcus saprophyticus]MDW3925700.1 DUF1024 family protein [Staphylococcus saprophyticus]